jgi:signal transduction histidine kinase
MASLHTSPASGGVEQLAARLRAERYGLVQRWQRGLNRFASGGSDPYLDDAGPVLSDLIAEIGRRLFEDAFGDRHGPCEALRAAGLLGDLRFSQGVPIGRVLDEWHALADVLQAFIREEAPTLDPPIDESDAARASTIVEAELRALQRRALESYAAGHQRTVDHLTTQLRRVSRLVIHEVRRPLSVLRVLARTLTVADGDFDAIRMVDILDRSVARLADVTRELDTDSSRTEDSAQSA